MFDSKPPRFEAGQPVIFHALRHGERARIICVRTWAAMDGSALYVVQLDGSHCEYGAYEHELEPIA